MLCWLNYLPICVGKVYQSIGLYISQFMHSQHHVPIGSHFLYYVYPLTVPCPAKHSSTALMLMCGALSTICAFSPLQYSVLSTVSEREMEGGRSCVA